MLGLLFTHLNEFFILLWYRLFFKRKWDIIVQEGRQTSGPVRQSMRRCWEFMSMKSRTITGMTMDLGGDLAQTACIFYLVLRGLDTIEDDMTIPDDVKQPILRSFHEKVVTPGWNFTGNGPDEKDRQLLVEFATVIEEVSLLKPEYRDIVLDVCAKMEVGMADYAHMAATAGPKSIGTIAEYDLYCHYVAGLVGEGTAAIWSVSGREAPWLREELVLANSFGLFIQKFDTISDFREDAEEGRFFWPREIWAKYGFEEIQELYQTGNLEHATWAQSEMILDALRHACDTLDYLNLLKNRSVFAGVAIVSSIAMATLALCFMNPEVFQHSINVRKAEAAQLAMRSSNMREVALTFRTYARKIHHKAKPQDPNFLRLSVMCGRIEQWYEQNYPSFVIPGQGGETYDPNDKRTAVIKLQERTRMMCDLKVASSSRKLFLWEFATYASGAISMVVLLSAVVIYMVAKAQLSSMVVD